MEATLLTILCSNIEQTRFSLICIFLYFLVNIVPNYCQNIAQDGPGLANVKQKPQLWTYHGSKGPNSWPLMFPSQCGLRRQSPINLLTNNALPANIPTLRLYGYDTLSVLMEAKNDGYVLKYSIKPDPNGPARYSYLKQPRNDMYVIQQMHLHWGNGVRPGSEHFIDGMQYPAEMHFVHKLEHKTLEQALQTPKGLLVLGVMVVVGQHDNPFYEPLIQAAAAVQFKNQSFQFSYNIPFRRLLPANIRQFYRYEGSLTTPTCNEVVLWTVFKNPIWLSERQMNILLSLKRTPVGESPLPMTDNFRPVQNLNGRTVYRVGF